MAQSLRGYQHFESAGPAFPLTRVAPYCEWFPAVVLALNVTGPLAGTLPETLPKPPKGAAPGTLFSLRQLGCVNGFVMA